MMDWDKVASDGTLPSMRANCVLKNWSEGQTAEGRLMYRIGWQIEDPEMFKGMFVNDNMYVGGAKDTDEAARMACDPNQSDSRRMKTMFTVLDVHLVSDEKACLKSAEGGKCVVFIAAPSQQEIKDGWDRNKVKNYYKLGSVDVGLLDGGNSSAGAGLPAAPPMPLPPSALPRPPVQGVGE